MLLGRFASLLRSVFGSNPRPERDETAERAARLEERVLKLVGNMPSLPDTATRAMAMADDPNMNMSVLAQLIEGDVALTTALLRMANSAFYSGGVPAAKLTQAIVRMGRFQCKNLIIAVSMKSLVWQMAGAEKAQCETLWQHGNLTGGLCRRIAQACRLQFDGAEFSAGLLHDLGRILLLLADPECFALADGLDFHEEPGLLERERAAIGIDHGALGGCFAEHSELPDSLVQAIKHHHEPEQMDNLLVSLVASADHMANHLQRGEDVETYNAEENVGLAFLSRAWREPRRERLRGEIPSLMAESLQAAAAEGAGG